MKKQSTLIALCLAMAPAMAMASQVFEGAHPLEINAEVKIENVAGSVVVSTWDKPEIWFRADCEEDVEDVEFDVDGDSAKIEVRIPERRKRRIQADLQVTIPRGASIEIRSVSASVRADDILGNADIETVSGLAWLHATASEVEIETVSGQVHAAGNIHVLKVETTSGAVQIPASGSDLKIESVSGRFLVEGDWDNLETETTSGAINIKGQVGDLKAESISGSIEALAVRHAAQASSCSGRVCVVGNGLAQVKTESISGHLIFQGSILPDADVELKSKSGDIRLELPRHTQAEFNLRSFSGKVSADQAESNVSSRGPGVRSEFRWGDGTAEIEAETFSGDITVRAN